MCSRLCERKWLRIIRNSNSASIANKNNSPTPNPIDVPMSAHTVDKSVAAGLGAGPALPVGDVVAVGVADAPTEPVAVPVFEVVGALVGLGDAPVEADDDGVMGGDGVNDALRVLVDDSDGLAVIDGDGVIEGDAPIDGDTDGDCVMLDVCEIDALGDDVHTPSSVHCHVGVSGTVCGVPI